MNLLYFTVCAIIWGSTWLAIKYQLGVVDPMLSIFYRFAAAVAILFVYCLSTRRPLGFSLKDHLFFLLAGTFMFGLNYWLVYLAEATLPSGLVAISFTTIIFFNALANRLFLSAPIVPKILLGGLLGMLGLALIFYPELQDFTFKGDTTAALLLCVIGAASVSFGNTAAQVCHRRNIPVIQMELFAMAYGGSLIGIAAMLRGIPITFDPRPAYSVSLLYLAVMGSIVAFLSYLTLLKNIGSDKAAYVTLVSPLVALGISTVFEGYAWTPPALIGVGIIVLGNVVALRKAKPRCRDQRRPKGAVGKFDV